MSDIVETVAFENITLVCGSYSDKGIRDENQDFYTIIKDTIVPTFIVADGAGGYHFGKEASQLAVNAFSKELLKIEDRSESYLKKLVYRKYEQVNEFIYNKSLDNSKIMMTTFSMVNVIERKILISNLGDTAVFLIRDNKISLISEIHSLAREQFERKEITLDQFLNHPKKNIITRALGGKKDVHPYFNSIELKDRDVIIICTDGIYNFIKEIELNNYFQGKKYNNVTLNTICKEIGEEVIKRQGTDNLTIVAFQAFVN